MISRELVASTLAANLLAGTWTPSTAAERITATLGRRTLEAQKALVDLIFEKAAGPYPPSPAALAALLLAAPAFDEAMAPVEQGRKRLYAALAPPLIHPAPAFWNVELPALATPGALARWLDVSPEHLDWFADSRHQATRTDTPDLQHYDHLFVAKKTGPPRLIEQPKPRLKAMQRRILREILDAVPPHPAAHGFVKGRSCLTGAEPHCGEAMVVTVDLRDFFPRSSIRRIHGIFRSLGYPWAVARLLTGLCTTATPRSVFTPLPAASRHDWQTQRMFAQPHLPQGAPTSPTLANLAAWRLDVRLDGLARAFDARYTRYADDLAFSGDTAFSDRIGTVLAAIRDIVGDEGHAINAAKTRIMGAGGRQRVTGVVVNQHRNVARDVYDELKAILHNCAENGPESQNRAGHPQFQAHLDGRVAWVEQVNPARGTKLRRLYGKIAWKAG